MFIKNTKYKYIWPIGKSLVFLIFLLFIFISTAEAQYKCTSALRNAKKLYNGGEIDEIPSLLEPCIVKGFSRKQKIEAFKLIVLAYLFDEDQYMAKRSMERFLRKFPEYELKPKDPVEFSYLFKTYQTTSIFSFGFFTGINACDPRILEPYSANDLTYGENTNSIGYGYHFGIGIERYLAKHLTFNLEAGFVQNTYEFHEKTEFIKENYSVYFQTNFKEMINRLDFPVTFCYQMGSNVFKFYLRTGINVGYLLYAQGIPSKSYSIYTTSENDESKPIDIGYYRKDITLCGVGGLGFKIKVPRGFIIFDFRANIGVNNFVEEPQRFGLSSVWTKYNYLDDNFSINNVMGTLGYYFSFYQPRKK